MRRTAHFVGPPPEASQGAETRSLLPFPQLLCIQVGDDGVFLIRFLLDGTFCGDTWHPTISEAYEQAAYEYPDAALGWIEIGPEVDAVVFVRGLDAQA